MFLRQKLRPRDMIISLVATQKMLSYLVIFFPGAAKGKKYVSICIQRSTGISNVHSLVNHGPFILEWQFFKFIKIVLFNLEFHRV